MNLVDHDPTFFYKVFKKKFTFWIEIEAVWTKWRN